MDIKTYYLSTNLIKPNCKENIRLRIYNFREIGPKMIMTFKIMLILPN